jgi:hypothetical protein
MKYVWSLWTKPLREGTRSAWGHERHHLLSWVLSLETARRHGQRTALVTDRAGAELLVERLGLEFDEVSTELDGLADDDPEFWALGKVVAYSIQNEPFVHIDSDVYLWHPLPQRLVSAPLFAQCPEHFRYGESGYRCAEFERAVQRCGGWLPPELDGYTAVDGIFEAVSCGIFGANDLAFSRYYGRQALQLVRHPKNRRAWPLLEQRSWVSLVFEQYLLGVMIAYHRGRPNSSFSDIDIAYLFESFQDAARNAAHAGYTHLLADTKRNPRILGRLEQRIRADYPDYHARCAALAYDYG